MECGVDFLLCELLWVSTGVAFFPFVNLAYGAEMASNGDYDPMAPGICYLMWASQDEVVCTGPDWKYTWTGGKVEIYMPLDYYNGATYCYASDGDPDNAECSENNIDLLLGGGGGSKAIFFMKQMYVIETYATSFLDSVSFYLNPVYFTMVVNHFYPTHNSVTSSPDHDQFNDFLDSSPFWKIFKFSGFDSADGVFSSSPQYLLFSVDENDEFHQFPQTSAFAALIKTGWVGKFAGVWAYDVPAIGAGHNYDLHDLILSIEWFSEAFRTWSLNPDAEYEAVEMPPKYMDSDKYSESKTIRTKPSDFLGTHAVNLNEMIDEGMIDEIGSIPVCYLAEITPWETQIWGQLTSEMELPADPMNPLCEGMFGPSDAMTFDDGKVGKKHTVRMAVEALDFKTLRAVNATLSHAEAHGDLEEYEENVHTSELYRCYMTQVLIPLVNSQEGAFKQLEAGIREDMNYIDTVCSAVWLDIEANGCDVCIKGSDVDNLWAPTSPTASYSDPMTGWESYYDNLKH